MGDEAVAGRAMRRPRRAAMAVAAVGALVLANGCVTNPGPFTATMGPGSFLQVVDEAGVPNPESFLDIGRPDCGNGVDDDLDGAVDGTDGQCDAAGDDNERLDGVQAFVAPTVPFQVEGDGHITVQPTNLVVPPVEHCVPGTGGEVWCLNVTVEGAGGERQGSINGGHFELPIPITLKFDAMVGFPGLDPLCESEYIDGPFTGEGYDETTGHVTTHVAGQTVQALTNCGTYNDGLNAVLGLPAEGRSTLELTLRNASGQPIDQN